MVERITNNANTMLIAILDVSISKNLKIIAIIDPNNKTNEATIDTIIFQIILRFLLIN